MTTTEVLVKRGEHYQAAEKLLSIYDERVQHGDGTERESPRELLMAAQVHATLAAVPDTTELV